MAEDRITEIIQNLDDHWGSPPILTPDTLAHILNHQWTNEELVNQEEIKKVSKVAAKATVAANRAIQNNNKAVSTLIEEVCRTIQSMDTENKYDVTKDIKSDPVIQKFIADKEVSSASSSSSTAVLGNEENVMQHLIELLQQHNMNNQNKVVDEST
ncbi:unnamed protein product [Mucor circinelloides]|uniref:Uncharacterized protein n=1 Tax=Mucor circinelloides f. circinelloides (strain 1006PhL) TaxID=1220926 RepID=S2JSY9_MUCC1|nr:hypothetical protein HMPREF1544_01524 [Mucor circinelloides 1006PhL]